MGYSKNALILRELPITTVVNPTDLTIVETASASFAIAAQDFSKAVTSVYYGFRIDPVTGDLNVDVINAPGSYDGTVYKDWFLGGLNITFTIDNNGEFFITI